MASTSDDFQTRITATTKTCGAVLGCGGTGRRKGKRCGRCGGRGHIIIKGGH